MWRRPWFKWPRPVRGRGMQKIRLDGAWDLSTRPEGGPDQAWVKTPAQVPGNVEIDLMKAGQLPDLFFGDHILKVRPLEFHEWRYERTFSLPGSAQGQTLELLFHGVDCVATYLLNNEKIGESANMLVPHSFDITDKVLWDRPNHLEVRIASPVRYASRFFVDPSQSAMSSNWDSLWVRKAPHSYGWDIMPRLLSAGIWRSVEVLVHPATEIKDLFFWTRWCNRESGEFGLLYQFQTDEPSLDGFEILVRGTCGSSVFEMRKPCLFTAGELSIPVPQASPWWPRGYGEASLYQVKTQLLRQGQIVDERQDAIGLRTVELDRTEITTRETPGQFLFKINGEPILCKGSNWVPLDALHSRDAGRYEQALDLFRDLGCNILRCWGGNVYEDHAFFELCDRYGIMVWQDFAMACARYPQAPEFQQVLREEALKVVRKLRNHPSIILWSGDNECDYGYPDPSHNLLTREVLPRVVRECDPTRPYLPSSPYFSPEMIRKGRRDDLMPEQHLWGPRDYYKSRFYAESTAHFASEMGYHGCPNVRSIQRFVDEQHWWPWQNNEQWRLHCTDTFETPGPYAYRVPLMANQIKEMFGFEPDQLKDFVVASQISQAEAKKFFVELFRLAKWRRTGVIWWNVLDGWPQFSDAVVDYGWGKKLAYHYLKRVQAPVCIMVDEPQDWHVRVAVGNDTLDGMSGPYRVWDADSGEILMDGTYHAAANQTSTLGRIRVSHGEHRLFLMEWEAQGRRAGNHYCLGKPPFDFPRYRNWLQKIASLPDSFDAASVGE